MRPVVLSGFMATGKTTIGKAVAARLGVPFVDTDEAIEARAGASIHDLFRNEGEPMFRERERSLVFELLADAAPKVIALGGGSVTTPDVRRAVTERALVVTLEANTDTILARTEHGGSRPNLAANDPAARIAALLDARAHAYAEAHLRIATDETSIDDVVEACAALVDRDPLLVPLGDRSYNIDACAGAPDRLTDAIVRLGPSSLVVVTDSNVQRARHTALDTTLHAFAIPIVRVTIPPGEIHKTSASVGAIWDAALGAGVDREAVFVAFGGGVIGDLAGFAASTMLRGVRVVQAPTTLLAMVDASVGGKTGFDHPAGKNLIGAFHQPSAVIADVAHLTTLPPRELRAGLAEIVKIGLATDEALLALVEDRAEALAAGDRDALAPLIRRAIEAKIRVVRDDEREQGRRALLNVGHTLGHALEAAGGFSRWLHGEAVALGTLAEMRVSKALGLVQDPPIERTFALFERLHLPTRAPRESWNAAWPFVSRDKKKAGTRIKLPLISRAGDAAVHAIPLDELKRGIDACADHL